MKWKHEFSVDLNMVEDEDGHITTSFTIGDEVRAVDHGDIRPLHYDAVVEAVEPSPHVGGAWLIRLRLMAGDSESTTGGEA